MTSAKERAVEEAWYAYEQLPEWDLDKVGVAAMLRAAFPILAEELVKPLDDEVRHLRCTTPDRFIGEDRSLYDEPATRLEAVARRLRARIEQMKEITE